MKFKDFYPEKMHELKENGKYPYEEEVKLSKGEALVYEYKVGICVILEQMLRLIFDEKKVGIGIKTDGSDSDDPWFTTHEIADALKFLKDKNTSEIKSVMIVSYKGDWGNETYFVLDFEKQAVYKSMRGDPDSKTEKHD